MNQGTRFGSRWAAVRRVTFAALAGGLFLAATGCQSPGPSFEGPIRAVWVTRFVYKTPQDVQRIIQNCSDAGFNTVLFQVRGNGTVFYPSKIEPWAEQFGFKDPGFDPLALAIKEAHARGMRLQAYMNVMPGWNGPDEPAVRNQLYYTHAEWFWHDAQGQRQPLVHRVGDRTRGWYLSLNPCLPEVRKYIVEVFREVAANYDVDGLHLDYIRFPNERVVPGEVIPDYPRDPRTLELFKRATGQTPESNPAAWSRWRADQVTQLVEDLHTMLRRTKPKAVLSASVGSVQKNALTHFQDTQQWIAKGIIDEVYLMNYTREPAEFTRRNEAWVGFDNKVRIIPGLSISGGADSVAVAKQQIASAREATGDFCIFSYSSIFDGGGRRGGDQGAARQARERRRTELVAYLKSLVEEKKPLQLF
jgi:uncharacterized lipoprotein YddW (UPF0748 family)